MKTYKILAFGLFLFCTNLTYAQKYDFFLDRYTYHKNNISRPASNNNDYADVEGTPYLSQEFAEGIVYLKDSTAYQMYLRYNMFTNEMEYQLNNLTYIIGNPNAIQQIILGESVFVYDPGVNDGGYFELLQSGKCSLLLKRSVHYQPSEGPKPIEGTITPARFIKESDVFYVLNSVTGTFEVENKKILLTALEDHRLEVESYMKKEKTRISKREDLSKLVAYYNSL
jgi:hypothetical protein